jgi:ATP-binding cassette, subfamily B, bacterial
MRSEFTVENARQYDQRSAYRWVWSHLWRYPLYILGMLIFRALAPFLFAVSQIYIGRAAGVILDPAAFPPNALLMAALGVLGGMVGNGIVSLISGFSAETAAQHLETDSREELYRGLLGKSQTFHDRQRVGDIMARATDDVRMVNVLLNPGVSLIWESIIGFLIPIIFIGFIYPPMLIVPVLYTISYLFAIRDYMRRLTPVSWQQRAMFGKMNAQLEESISGIETVKAAAQEPFEREKFSTNARNFREFFVKQGRVEAGYLPLMLYGIAYGLMFLHAITLYRAGVLAIPQLVQIIGLFNMLAFPTFISIWSFPLIQLGLASSRRILEVLSAETELDENRGGHKSPIRGDIIFDHVSFGYGETAFGVKNISFHIGAGQTVAIVGETGSGKTTLTLLVNRTYDVDSGQILIDGVDVRAWDLDALRSQISKIEQDVFLFSRTIRENIAFGKPDATQAEIEQAAREAQAHDFIISFENGYETVIGERGVTLSGGQRQRIALARAFLSSPRILVLDDSTSAIDSATEDEIQRAIQAARQGRTTLLITHRLSQIRWADTILVMQHGGIAARGTHDELLRRSDLYRRIFARYEAELPPLEVDAVGG